MRLSTELSRLKFFRRAVTPLSMNARYWEQTGRRRRRGGRFAAVRRQRTFRHRVPSRRPELSASLCFGTVFSVNTVASGGNATLLAEDE